MGADRLLEIRPAWDEGRYDRDRRPGWSEALTRLVWLIPLVSTGLTLASIWLFLENLKFNTALQNTISPYDVVLGVAYPLIGALIIFRKPRNPSGWIFCLMGVAGALTSFSAQYPIFVYTHQL